jgi:hypothetical protein
MDAVKMVTVARGTEAQTCRADGSFHANIRPLPFTMDRACAVVQEGDAPARGYAKGYHWYVVKVFSGYVFVTEHNLVQA